MNNDTRKIKTGLRNGRQVIYTDDPDFNSDIEERDFDEFFGKQEYLNALDITSNTYLYLCDLNNPTHFQKKQMRYFENNICNHFVKINTY